MKVTAGLSKLFRPAAPSTVRKYGSSKVRPLKNCGGSGSKGAGGVECGGGGGGGGVGEGGGGGEESLSDASSFGLETKDGETISSGNVLSVSAAVAMPHTEADKRIDNNHITLHRDSFAHQVDDENTPEWSQLPGAIPDHDEQVTEHRTPPIHKKKAYMPSPKLNGNAINPDDVEKVPQADKKYVRDVRARRVMKEFRAVTKACNHPDSTFSVELVDDNLYDWNIKLFEVDPLSPLHYDMEKDDIPFILFNMSFADNFPFTPPFVRVVSPRIDNGFVMDGGAICMELLTPGGWSSAYTIEAIVMQLGAALVAGRARVSTGKRYRLFGDVPFNKQEAVDSFRNVVETHKRYGWSSPAGDFS